MAGGGGRAGDAGTCDVDGWGGIAGRSGCGDDDDDEGVGTCWNARCASATDMRVMEVALCVEDDIVAGGVSPSSDFISCIVKDRGVGSSAMPCSEFPDGLPSLSNVCDQTCFKCSGSGACLDGELIIGKLSGDWPQAADNTGVFGASPACVNSIDATTTGYVLTCPGRVVLDVEAGVSDF